MTDTFTLPRQACRCGNVFADWQSFRAHARPASPVDQHQDPAELGMTLVDGEWAFRKQESVTITKAAKPEPQPRPEPKPYVRAADRPDSEYERTCESCGKVFLRPRKRGRPPKKCPTCRGI